MPIIFGVEENMKNVKLIAVVLSISLFLIGCAEMPGKMESSQDRTFENVKSAPIQAEEDIVADGDKKDSDGGGKSSRGRDEKISLDKAGQSQNAAVKPITRKIIRNANLQLETDSPEEAQKKITAIANSKKGFVVKSRKTSSEVRNRARDTVSMTIRIPADKFNESIDEIRKNRKPCA